MSVKIRVELKLHVDVQFDRCVTENEDKLATNKRLRRPAKGWLWAKELLVSYIRAASWQNQQNDYVPSEDSDQPGHPPSLIPAKTLISLVIRPVWSESSLCAQWVAKDPNFLHADSEDSDQTGRPFCWFFHEAAYSTNRSTICCLQIKQSTDLACQFARAAYLDLWLTGLTGSIESLVHFNIELLNACLTSFSLYDIRLPWQKIVLSYVLAKNASFISTISPFSLN